MREISAVDAPCLAASTSAAFSLASNDCMWEAALTAPHLIRCCRVEAFRQFVYLRRRIVKTLRLKSLGAVFSYRCLVTLNSCCAAVALRMAGVNILRSLRSSSSIDMSGYMACNLAVLAGTPYTLACDMFFCVFFFKIYIYIYK